MQKALATLALLATTTLTAQTKPAPPTLGPIVGYQYWPTQYIQFVTGPELPYSMFALEVDTTGKEPLYHAILTAKDGTRTHYSNTDALTATFAAQHEGSYKTTFAIESDDTEKPGSTFTVRFTAHDEKPVEFRFVQGSDISEQGGGLQPVPQAPIPVFAYRELGALAGEGTALKIGDTVSTAEVWKEYAHPPYFIPYRGAVTQHAHQVVLPKIAESWTVVKYPTALAPGNTWEMDSDRQDHLTLRIDKAEGTHFTLTATDRQHPATRIVVEATRTPGAAGSNDQGTFATDRVLYMPTVKGGEKHAVAFTFTPGLTTGTATPTNTTGTMDIGIAKKKSIATATLTQTGDAADRTTSITFTTPAWAANKTLTEETKRNADTLTLTAR